MRVFNLLLLFSILLAICNTNSNAQCIPDPTCIDIINPGEICPETLPAGTTGSSYNQAITIIPPYQANVGSKNISVPISKVKITAINNMPPGLTWKTNVSEFTVTNPATKYCIFVSGIPYITGTYNLGIKVKPYALIGGNEIALAELENDTSLSITIGTINDINDINRGFSIINPSPNPFNNSTQLGFYTNKSNTVELKIYDMIGKLIYKETINGLAGTNYFRFNGSKLNQGMYLYTISDKKTVFTKQLTKTD